MKIKISPLIVIALISSCGDSFDNGVPENLVGVAACASIGSEATTLRVAAENLKNEVGFLRVALYDKADGFPGENKLALDGVSKRIEDGDTCFVFPNLIAGKTYAISMLHDEDEDGELATNFVGAPAEGYGVSNNAPQEGANPPAYSKAEFEFNSDENLMLIPVRY